MADLIYVPDWMDTYLSEQGMSYGDLAAMNSSSSIVNRLDVINYHVAQVEFAKLLAYDTARTGLASNVDNIYEEILGAMRLHPSRDIETVVQVNLAKGKKEINYGSLVQGATGPDNLAFKYEIDTTGKIVYIIGMCCVQASGEDCTVSAVSQRALKRILEISHGGLRVHTGYVDKSTVLRENPVLATFYVNSLLAS